MVIKEVSILRITIEGHIIFHYTRVKGNCINNTIGIDENNVLHWWKKQMYRLRISDDNQPGSGSPRVAGPVVPKALMTIGASLSTTDVLIMYLSHLLLY